MNDMDEEQKLTIELGAVSVKVVLLNINILSYLLDMQSSIR
jgi:hypothetical protein